METIPCQPFADNWYFMGLMNDYEKGRIYSKMLCGRDILLIKVSDSIVKVFDDICPHYKIKLSDFFNDRHPAKLTEHNEIVCYYHRYRYNLDGDHTGCEFGQFNPTEPLNGYEVDIKYGQLILVYVHSRSHKPTGKLPEFGQLWGEDAHFISTKTTLSSGNTLECYQNILSALKNAKALAYQNRHGSIGLQFSDEPEATEQSTGSLCCISGSFHPRQYPKVTLTIALAISPVDEKTSTLTTIVRANTAAVSGRILPLKQLQRRVRHLLLARQITEKRLEAWING